MEAEPKATDDVVDYIVMAGRLLSSVLLLRCAFWQGKFLERPGISSRRYILEMVGITALVILSILMMAFSFLELWRFDTT